MRDYDARLELAPRDVVARSIERELAKLDTWCVYLDATHLDAAELQEAFPTIWAKLRSIGIQMENDWIPIVPAQHYSCGGAVANLRAQTSLPGLYASGEAASTGVHGANRLASNSLLEAIVFSESAAKAIEDEPLPANDVIEPTPPRTLPESEAIRIRHQIQRIMSTKVGIFRSNQGLKEASEGLAKIRKDLEKQPAAPFSIYGAETWNLLDVAELVVQGALDRKVNVGLHYNVDNES